MIARVGPLVIAMLTCASGACRGGPRDESSAYCQNAILGARIPPSRRADVCDACCHQDDVHHGRIVNGQCSCYP